MNAVAGTARSEVAAKFFEVSWEAIPAAAEVTAEGVGGAAVAAGGAAETEVDTAGKERGQRSELLGDHEGAWFGSMIPPEPTRMRDVPAATCPMTTAVAALAIPGSP